MRLFSGFPESFRNILKEHAGRSIPGVFITVDTGFAKITVPSQFGVESISIDTGVDIRPSNLGVIRLTDIQLDFQDGERYFTPRSVESESGGVTSSELETWSPFYQFLSLLSESSDNDSAKVTDLSGRPAKNTFVQFVKNGLTEIAFLDTVEKNADNSWNVEFETGSLTNIYSANDILMAGQLTGKKIYVDFFFNGNSYKHRLYTGTATGNFDGDRDKASISLTHGMKDFFENELLIQPESEDVLSYYNSEGVLTNSLSVSEGSTGTIDEDAITVNPGAVPGRYQIIFDSATSFTVKGPNIEKTGNIYDNWYDKGYTDSTVVIDDAGWGGTFSDGDVVSFYVSVNFTGASAAEHIYNMLVVYGGIQTSKIDVSDSGINDFTTDGLTHTFNWVNNLYSGYDVNLSFIKSTKIGDAVHCMNQHICSWLFDSGQFKLFTLHKDFGTTHFDIDFEIDHHVINSTKKESYLKNVFTGKYKYDVTAGSYEADVTFPESDVENKSYSAFGVKEQCEVLFPGYQDSAKVKVILKRMYAAYAWRLQTFEIETSLVGIGVEPGSIINLDNLNDGEDMLVYNAAPALLGRNRVYLSCFPKIKLDENSV